MINLVRTRLHDRNSGAVTGGVHQLEFRGSEIMVLSLELENAASMSDLEFELVPGEFNIDNGAVRYDRGLSFEKKDRLARSFTSLNPSVLLRNVSPTVSEFLYLQVDPSLLPVSSGNFSFKWRFSHVEGSRSLSSSSSNEYSECQLASVGDEIHVTIPSYESRCFNVSLESTTYMTIFANGVPIEVYNDGGTLQVDGEDTYVGGAVTLTSGGVVYEVLVTYSNYIDTFVVIITNIVTPLNNVEFRLSSSSGSLSSSSDSDSSSSSST